MVFPSSGRLMREPWTRKELLDCFAFSAIGKNIAELNERRSLADDGRLRILGLTKECIYIDGLPHDFGRRRSDTTLGVF